MKPSRNARRQARELKHFAEAERAIQQRTTPEQEQALQDIVDMDQAMGLFDAPAAQKEKPFREPHGKYWNEFHRKFMPDPERKQK